MGKIWKMTIGNTILFIILGIDLLVLIISAVVLQVRWNKWIKSIESRRNIYYERARRIRKSSGPNIFNK